MERESQAMRFVIFREDEVFVAVCLEHFIGAQGSDEEQLKLRLQTAYRAERDDTLARSGIPFEGIPPAPERYREMWETDGPGVMRGTIVALSDAEISLAA
jgi:hypothetical protein